MIILGGVLREWESLLPIPNEAIRGRTLLVEQAAVNINLLRMNLSEVPPQNSISQWRQAVF